MRSFFLLFLLSFFFLGCSKDELTYSCDSEIDRWVKANKQVYSNISRDSLKFLSFKKQLGLYRSFSSKHKIKLWTAKIEVLLSDDKFSDREKEHFLKLIEYVKPVHFESESGRIEFSIFAEEWERYGRTYFGWKDEDLFYSTHILLTKKEFLDRKNIDLTSKEMSLPGLDTGKDCECLYSIYCSGSQTCSKGNCKISDGGCGILGTSNCKGYCD